VSAGDGGAVCAVGGSLVYSLLFIVYRLSFGK
jgi:formiminotetrahydrofolate cyclodeaminase